MKVHGLFFEELLRFVRSRWDLSTEKKMLSLSGLSHRQYTSKRYYDDEEMVILLLNLSRLVGRSVSSILLEYGEYIVPSYYSRYEKFFSRYETLFEFLKSFEMTTHRQIRAHTQGNPPEIRFLGIENEDTIVISYYSERQLCDLAKGMLKGFARLFKEKIDVSEGQCLHKGASYCKLIIKRLEHTDKKVIEGNVSIR